MAYCDVAPRLRRQALPGFRLAPTQAPDPARDHDMKIEFRPRWSFANLLLASVVAAASFCARSLPAEDKPQYEFEGISVPSASADEPRRDKVSTKLAVEHLENAARAWNGSRKCVTCHTNGTYMTIRPALTPALG